MKMGELLVSLRGDEYVTITFISYSAMHRKRSVQVELVLRRTKKHVRCQI